MANQSGNTRMRGLDVLRGIAVLLVLGHHRYLWQPWAKVGWAGVQLFFVLSGFLISGLLFREYQRSGSIDLRRFLIRRGLKIYPPFYLFILLSVLYEARSGIRFTLDQLLAEAFFVQSYHRGVWEHTWSLAVEEHFYILLPVTLWLLARRAHPARRAFEKLPAALVLVMVLTLIARTLTVLSVRPITLAVHLMPTHLNLDGLATGVLVSYAYHFHFPRFTATVDRYRVWLACGATIGLLPCLLLWRDNPWMVSVGLTVVNFGFAAMLILALTSKGRAPGALRHVSRWLGGGVAYVGMHSYAIYLWHMAVNEWAVVKFRLLLNRPPSAGIDFLCYLAGSIVLGVLLTQLVERPSLWIRDRIWPSRSSQPATGTASGQLMQSAS